MFLACCDNNPRHARVPTHILGDLSEQLIACGVGVGERRAQLGQPRLRLRREATRRLARGDQPVDIALVGLGARCDLHHTQRGTRHSQKKRHGTVQW